MSAPLVICVEVEIPELSLRGYSLFVEFTEDDHLWTIACSNRAIVTVPQKKVLMGKSYTANRGQTAEDMKKLFELRGLSPC
jgi:hypothetical protein